MWLSGFDLCDLRLRNDETESEIRSQRIINKVVTVLWISGFSSYEIELHKLTSHFELLTRRLNFCFSTFELLTRSQGKVFLRVTNSTLENKELHSNSMLKNKKFCFKLLTRSRKIKSYTKKKFLLQVINSKVKLFLFHFRVTNSKFKNI